MRRLGIELTDRCNLSCKHCLREINADRADLASDLARRILADAAAIGIREVVFTGGEPTLHHGFAGIVRCAVAHGLGVTVVTNGQRPEPLWQVLAEPSMRERVTVALSLEAEEAEAFDAIRGKHAYRRFMGTVLGLQARRAHMRFSVCIGTWNRERLPGILVFAAQVGAEAVSVSCYQPSRGELAACRDMRELAELHAEIEAAAAASPVPTVLAFEPITTRATHLCATLGLEDLNVNHRGEATFCCQLSTLYRSPHPEAVVVADLNVGDLGRAAAAQAHRVAAFLEAKLEAWRGGPPQPSDVNPCAYCLRTFGQVAWEAEKNAA